MRHSVLTINELYYFELKEHIYGLIIYISMDIYYWAMDRVEVAAIEERN